MHTPTGATDKAIAQARDTGVDGIVSVGGGSTIGLRKAISVRTGLHHLCVPTTYAGSEMTPILGETEDRRKVTRRDSWILPTAVLYDVHLTMTLPVRMSVYSGINVIAHSGWHFPSFNPLTVSSYTKTLADSQCFLQSRHSMPAIPIHHQPNGLPRH